MGNLREEESIPHVAEERHIRLQSPATPAGIIDVVRHALRHDVQSIVVRPGSEIVVEWVSHTPDEDLLTVLPDDPVSALLRIELFEVSDITACMKTALTNALVDLTFRGLAANILVVSSIKDFKETLGIPAMLHLPKFGLAQVTRFAGMKLFEVGDKIANNVVIILAAEERTDDAGQCTVGVQLGY